MGRSKDNVNKYRKPVGWYSSKTKNGFRTTTNNGFRTTTNNGFRTTTNNGILATTNNGFGPTIDPSGGATNTTNNPTALFVPPATSGVKKFPSDDTSAYVEIMRPMTKEERGVELRPDMKAQLMDGYVALAAQLFQIIDTSGNPTLLAQASHVMDRFKEAKRYIEEKENSVSMQEFAAVDEQYDDMTVARTAMDLS